MIIMMVALTASLSAQSFPFTPAHPGQYTYWSFQRRMLTFATFQSQLPRFQFSVLVASSLTLWGWWHMWSDCRLLRQSSTWVTAPTSTVKLDCIGCIVFMHGSGTLPDTVTVKPHPDWSLWLNHQCTPRDLAVCCFLEWEAWSLIPFCLLAILKSAFPSFLSGMSVWVCLGTFPTLWFAWALSAGILAALSLLLYPSQSPSLCVIHSFMEWVVGISDGSEECFDLLHFISVSAQSTWKWQLYMDLICASKQTHFALDTWNSEQVPVELYTQRNLNSHQGGSFTELFGCYIATWNCYGLCTWSVNTIQPCTTLLL